MANKHIGTQQAERKKANKLRHHNELRAKISYTKQMQAIEAILSAHYDKDEIPEATMKLNGRFKLLNKLLPDAVNVQELDTATESLVKAMTESLQLANQRANEKIIPNTINSLPELVEDKE